MYALTTHQLRWRGERDIDQSSVCAHHTPATGGEEESHRANQVYALTKQLQVRERERRERHRPNQVYATQPHTSYRWTREERVIDDNQVYALTTQQLQVERRES